MANGALAAKPPWLARIETPDGAVLGTGFLVDEDVVLTCAHVVDPPGPGTPTEVAVCFVHSDSARPVPGHVTRSDYHPLASPDDSVDLAVIRLAGPRPQGTRLAPLADSPSLAGQQLVLKGFPAGREWGDTVRALAVAEGGPRAGWWELHGEAGRGGTWVDLGFSGGPVWSDTLDAVVAVTVARWPSADERESYAIPLATVIEAYPDLGLRVVPALGDNRAEDRLRRSLVTLVTRHGPTDARSISARYGLAQLLALQGVALDEAVQLLRQCLADTDAGRHPPRRKIGMWWALGEALMEQSRYEEALDCLETAQQLAEEHSGPDDLRLSGLLTSKGLALIRLVRLPEAAEALGRADQLAGSAQGGEIARILYVRAMLAMASDMDEAERLAQQSYDITRETFGVDHPAVVRPAGFLGEILVRQQSFRRARRLLEEALGVAEARYPSNHPQVAMCRGAVGRLELVEGNPESAFRVCSQALHQAKAAFGDDDPRTAPYLVQMAYARQAKGDPAEALRLAERAVQVADRGSSTYQHERSEALYTRAEMRGWQNDFRNALVDAERALEIMVRLHGNGSPMTAQPAALVAYLLIFTGQPAQAERLARQVLGLVEGKGTVNQLLVASCRTTLAQAAAQQGRLDEAEDQYREVLRLLESLHGSEHSLVGMRYVELGVVQRRRMHFQDAEHSLRRGLDILTKTLPPDHPSVVNARRLAGPATRVRRFMDRLGR